MKNEFDQLNKVTKSMFESHKGWHINKIRSTPLCNIPVIYVYIYTPDKAIAIGGIYFDKINELSLELKESELCLDIVMQVLTHLIKELHVHSEDNKAIALVRDINDKIIQFSIYYMLFTKTGDEIINSIRQSSRSMSFFVITKQDNDKVLFRPFATYDDNIIEVTDGLKLVKRVIETDLQTT